MASSVIAGVLNVRVDGRILSTNGKIKINNMGGELLEAMPQVDGSVKYKRSVQAADVEVTVSTVQGLDFRKLKDSRFVSVALQAASGHTYVLRDAVQVGAGEIDVEGGEMTLKFNASRVDTI